MTDIALKWNASGLGDIVSTGSDLATDDGLETAILISVFTDRLADVDQLPDGGVSRRGWWGDIDGLPGDHIGSLIWTLEREKNIASAIEKANNFLRDCVKWLVDDSVCARVDTLAQAGTRADEIDFYIGAYRPNGSFVKSRYTYNWQAQAMKIIG